MSPAAVYLSVTQAAVFRAQRSRLLSVLKRHGGRIPFFIGGQGIPAEDDDISNAGAVLWRQTRPSEKTGTRSGSPGAGRRARSSRTVLRAPKAPARGASLAKTRSAR
jgi:hypothetical protein